MKKTRTLWPVCHMCGLRCSPTGAWIECATPGADREQVAIHYVNNLRGRICDLPGHTLDLIASQLPAHRLNYFERRAEAEAEFEKVEKLLRGGKP